MTTHPCKCQWAIWWLRLNSCICFWCPWSEGALLENMLSLIHQTLSHEEKTIVDAVQCDMAAQFGIYTLLLRSEVEHGAFLSSPKAQKPCDRGHMPA